MVFAVEVLLRAKRRLHGWLLAFDELGRGVAAGRRLPNQRRLLRLLLHELPLQHEPGPRADARADGDAQADGRFITWTYVRADGRGDSLPGGPRFGRRTV